MQFSKRLGSAVLAVSLLAGAAGVTAFASDNDPFQVKVMVFTLIEPETQPWLENETITRTFDVAGAYAPVSCTADGLCVTTTGMGKANAALTTSAVLNADELDLSEAIFLSAGIAGTPPEVGTLGDAFWADWVVDFDLGHHILPETDAPATDDIFVPMDGQAGTEVFRLNPALVDLAYETTKALELPDSDKAKAYRALFPFQEKQVPDVGRGDTVTGDNYWHGKELSQVATDLTKARTGGQGNYAATQMEDSAIAAALFRAGYLNRYTALRTISNFDQPHEGQTVKESMATSSGGFPLSIASEYLVGSAFADYVIENHDEVLALTGGNLAESAFTVTVGGERLTGPVMLESDRTLVQADVLSAALGVSYTWDKAAQTIRIEKDGQVLTLPVVTATATVGGTEHALETGARVYGGDKYVPLRFVAEQLGFTVGWNGGAGAVTVE